MTPELETLATARHQAWLSWDGSEGSFQRFVDANRAYVAARDNQRPRPANSPASPLTQSRAKANPQASVGA